MYSFFCNILSIPDCSFIPALHQQCRKNKPDNFVEKTNHHLSEKISENNFLMNDDLILGFQNGLAGLGITLLTELDGDDSWISLFPY